MLAPSQGHGVRDGEFLAGAEGRRQILQGTEVRSQVYDRQAVIGRKLGNTGNPQLPFNVVDVGEVVDRVVGAAVINKAQRVEEQTLHRRVSEVGVVVVNGQLAAQPRKGVQHGIAKIVKDEAAIEALSPVRALFCLVLSLLLLAILRATSATSKETKRSRRLRSKAVVEADEHCVSAAGRRGDEMKILVRAGKIR